MHNIANKQLLVSVMGDGLQKVLLQVELINAVDIHHNNRQHGAEVLFQFLEIVKSASTTDITNLPVPLLYKTCGKFRTIVPHNCDAYEHSTYKPQYDLHESTSSPILLDDRERISDQQTSSENFENQQLPAKTAAFTELFPKPSTESTSLLAVSLEPTKQLRKNNEWRDVAPLWNDTEPIEHILSLVNEIVAKHNLLNNFDNQQPYWSFRSAGEILEFCFAITQDVFKLANHNNCGMWSKIDKTVINNALQGKIVYPAIMLLSICWFLLKLTIVAFWFVLIYSSASHVVHARDISEALNILRAAPSVPPVTVRIANEEIIVIEMILQVITPDTDAQMSDHDCGYFQYSKINEDNDYSVMRLGLNTVIHLLTSPVQHHHAQILPGNTNFSQQITALIQKTVELDALKRNERRCHLVHWSTNEEFRSPVRMMLQCVCHYLFTVCKYCTNEMRLN